MSTIYELDSNSIWTGRTRELDKGEGRPRNWTATTPPDVPDGKMAQLRGHVWVVIDAVPLSDVQRAANKKLPLVDQWRDEAFAAGMTYTFGDGDEDVVQTRPADKVNLLGLNAKAEAMIAAGDSSSIPFRGQSNVTRMLSPQEMQAMTLAALDHLESIYAQSWQLKDTLRNATTPDEVEAVAWEGVVTE